ncbi:type I-C CRISPR-associated protein Cas8c/Csd1 [Thermoactinospora rubra]|uniref:type I-C CRISPR-associated protein Cas8c/Csd1 n=1 Tax=Thermoactinospora rubra TaxID=1088767 RepID=UPI001F0B6F53|nr:type I-C CRISPR-associated protein Cas8c/Csd1 [Thermoactinospora rubra]
MLLQRLVAYGRADEHVVPAYYKDKPVRWVLELSEDGALASPELISLADPADPRSKNGAVHTVPSIVKTSGIAPTLAVDTPEYLFGWTDATTKNPERVALMHQRFRELVDAWVEADPCGPGRPLQRFLAEGHLARLPKPSGWSRGDLVAVRVQGRFLHATESAREFWAKVAGSRKSTGRQGVCLVCGQVGDLLATIPQQLPARLVPKATQSASLVSINKATHGFALQEQLLHAPICARCGLLAMGALERLLNDQWHNMITGQDTRLVWWVTEDSPLDMGVLTDPPGPRDVARRLSDALRGRPLPDEDDEDGEEWERFCALAIGGNVSRVMVREWIESPLPRIVRNLKAWFDDHEIADMWTGEPRLFGPGRLVYAAGRWIRGKERRAGAYAKLGAPGADRPDGLYWGLMRSALLGSPLPPKLMAHLVHRISTDGRVDAERAALLRLALRRHRHLPRAERELYMPTLNPENNKPAYLSGRIFAVLEDIQLSAARANKEEPPNTTFADKYWGRANTSPAVALRAGAEKSRAWLKRMNRHKPSWAASAQFRLENLMGELALAGGPPHGATLADKTAFILGYYQQCAELRSRRSGDKPDTPNPDPQGEAS